MSIFEGFRRGNPDSQRAELPNDSFMREEAVLKSKSLRFSDGKFFLGLAGPQILSHQLPDGRNEKYAMGGTPIGIADDRHVVLTAGSRAGKGRSVLVPNLLMYPGSTLVIDPKSDLAQLTAAQRERMGQTVCVIDPFAVAGPAMKKYAASFNPLAMLDPSGRNLLADAGLIADALIMSDTDSDKHWTDSAKQLVEGLIIHVATYAAYEGRRDLVQVYELLWRALILAPAGDPTCKYALQSELNSNVAANGAVLHASRDFYERSDRERDSVLSTARTHLHCLGYPELQKTLRGPSIDLRDLKRKKMTVYLCLPAMRMGSMSRWLRLFVNMTLNAMETEKTKPLHAVLLILEEMAILGHLKAIEDAAGQIAGLGCRLLSVVQDFGQLKSLYRDRWQTFLGNAGIIAAFGNADETSIEYLSKQLGKTTVMSPSQGTPTYFDAAKTGNTGRSWSHTVTDLMTPSEVAHYFSRESLRQLVLRPGAPPMALYRAYYDKHELFQGKFKDIHGAPPLRAAHQ